MNGSQILFLGVIIVALFVVICIIIGRIRDIKEAAVRNTDEGIKKRYEEYENSLKERENNVKMSENSLKARESILAGREVAYSERYNRYIKDAHAIVSKKDSIINTATDNAKKIIEDAKEEIRISKAKSEEEIRELRSVFSSKLSLELNAFETELQQRCAVYPYLAGAAADLQLIHFSRIATYLENKPRPAYIEARRIRELRIETKSILSEKKNLEYKLAYIKALYPNIEDIFDPGFVEDEFSLETDDTTDRVRYFISEEDYKSLSVSERNQLALDRYVEGRKSKWQIGRDYEMYVGHRYEEKGYKVAYTGILENLEDMGRDLIAQKGKTTLIIQCKNWSQEKTLHEKHIFQLYGTVVLYSLDHPDENVSGLFITSTSLSDKARAIANYLTITCRENLPLGSFPRIKCNINRTTKEKIYHLPFDQQYDNVVIEPQHGECYATTVKEAEEKGFRRAFKHFAS